jgi:hypothetical protein
MKTTRLGKRASHVLRPVGGMNLDDVAVLECKVRRRGEGAVAHDEHVAARQLEETLDVGDIFAAAIALPRQTAAEADVLIISDYGISDETGTDADFIVVMHWDGVLMLWLSMK